MGGSKGPPVSSSDFEQEIRRTTCNVSLRSANADSCSRIVFYKVRKPPKHYYFALPISVSI